MSHRVYVRPVGMAESPQLYDGDCIRLGGSLVWCHMLEIAVYDAGHRKQHILTSVSNFANALNDLHADLVQSAQQQFANLSKTHAPLELGGRTVRFDQPQIMGILNVTPDSFSDGGQFDDDVVAAAGAGFAMSETGAAMIDIGGESTRPDAPAVWEGDEIKRVVPVIEKLAPGGTVISIDTRKAAVMEAALAAGAHIINDISALSHDERALDIAAQAGCPVILMHSPSSGTDPHVNDGYSNVVTDVFDHLQERIEVAVAGGIRRENIIVDPGIGFGKSLQDNLALINNLALFHALGQPILFGASRKRMIGALSKEAPADQRLAGSLILAQQAMESGAHIIRVHDAAETVQAMHVWRGLRDAALTAM
ncbi:dihydropteroate synthase [Sphingorhabdus sp. Alg239-R122]|uniref:dihydropteroate synthase n=1 Tax=Sphingorhabdus sp. Alg239-R122 TaxID=2305989 RepID=UPI0013DBCB29|nr:dihydropteroate synthase [Sphingorhabdus sp. Alg239-R122]